MRMSDWSSDVCSSDLTSFDIFVNDARFATRDFIARLSLPSNGGRTMTHIFASAAAGALRRVGVPAPSGAINRTGAAVLRGRLEEGSFETRFCRTYQKGETGRLPPAAVDLARCRPEAVGVGKGWVSRGRSRW